jgi:hypothetical protein
MSLRLARRALQEGAQLVDAWAYRGLLSPLLTKRFADSFRDAVRRTGEPPYFVVAVPGILHFLAPCLRLAKRHVSPVLVLNGLPRWEEQVLAEDFPAVPRVRLPVPTGFGLLAHGLVVELILRFTDGEVRLHDPDLYVFDPSVYRELSLGDREVAVGAFGVRNERTGVTFPTTHLLALRALELREILRRRRIGAGRYRRTPRRVAADLSRLGFGNHNFPKSYLPYYDVLHLSLAVAVAEGWTLRSLDAGDTRALHIGGVSYLTKNYHLDYLNHRFLALPTSARFAEAYRPMLRGQGVEEARGRFQGPGAEANLRRIDAALERLTTEIAR